MTQWLTDLSGWLFGLFVALWDALKNILYDLAVWVFGVLGNAIATAVAAIPVPSFMTSYSINALLNDMGACPVAYFNALGVSTAFSIILSGVLFNLIRKILTVGQW